ncbi:MAG: hypothetical protein K1X67_23275 [Fimbriimonadaceae bacterium]|nr:hypothetical protein [Fimbriimonadaceae bacterium]
MSFALRLASDLVQVDAGATVPLGVEASNRDDDADTYEIQIEGLDPEWTAVPVPSFTVEGHDIHTEKIFLKPPRVTESLAGTYPFVVTLRSLNSGETRSAQGVLEIRPFHHISVDVSPKKGSVSPFNKECTFDVTVMNLGNSEHTLQLFASDPDDECAFDFDPDKVTVGPGQQKTVAMQASGKRRPFLANSRLYGLSASARSVSMPTVVGNAQAQLEQKALISPGGFILLLCTLFLIIGWAFFMPKPPTLDVFTAVPNEVMVGESIRVDWRASANSKNVRIVAGKQVFASLDVRGSLDIETQEAGSLEISGFAVAGDKQSSPKVVIVKVLPRPVVPEPVIRSFKLEPAKVSLGEPVTVKFEVNEAVTKATLWPQGLSLDPRVGEAQFTPSTTGTLTFRLVVENSEGKRAETEAKITVEKASQARILAFETEPPTLDSAGGVSRLSWTVTGSAIVELSYVDDAGVKQKMRVDAQSTFDASLTKTTSFTLTATDAEGLTTTKTVKVEVKPKPDTPPDDPEPTGTNASTTGN